MPYIKPESRPEYENAIEFIVSHLRASRDAGEKYKGDVNYILSKIIISVFAEPDFGYDQRSDGVSALENAKLEFYRVYVADYEDKKRQENGAVLPLPNKRKLEV